MKKLYLTFTLSILFGLTSFAQNTSLSLPFKVRAPQVGVVNPPLLILMHGYGSNEKDLFSFSKNIPGEYLVVSIQGPYTLGNDSYAWFRMDFSNGKRTRNLDDVAKSSEMIIKFIDELSEVYEFDKNRVILSGFSQGGIMSYSLALTHPDRVYGIGVLSGFILDNTQPSSSKSIQDLKVFISHGTEDPLISISEAQQAKEKIESLGITPEYHEYQAKHEINQAMFTDYLKWLQQVK